MGSKKRGFSFPCSRKRCLPSMSSVQEIILAPSLLSADFSCLGEAAKNAEAAQAEYLHIDIMDGHFVPNFTFGYSMVRALRPHSGAFFDVHLMIETPDRYLKEFAEAGADGITVQVEACLHLDRTLEQIQSLGKRVGAALNPHTPLSALEYVLDRIDLINVMTVNPGFGGQKFLTSMLPKIEDAKRMIERSLRPILIQIDGGVTLDTVEAAVKAGANVLVAGSSVYGVPQGVTAAVANLRQRADNARS